MPAQMGRTGRPLLAIAQQEQRCAAFDRAQAEAPADCEVEHFRGATDIGDDAGFTLVGASCSAEAVARVPARSATFHRGRMVHGSVGKA